MNRRPGRIAIVALGGVALITVVAVGLWRARVRSTVPRGADASRTAATDGADVTGPAGAEYVGGAACAECHDDEYRAWRDSHHALAMQEAKDGTVLGDFAGAKLTYAGVTSTFFQRDGRYFVNTDGPDGSLRDYEIPYTFGVFPLQQYLIEFPDGRVQALGIAWDSRPRKAGGQRWFHLYPNEPIRSGHVLHWTGLAQNWNAMCSECHSTNLRRNFDAAADTFRTSWSEINVACEACHGPGSKHVEWARGGGDGSDQAKDPPPEQGDAQVKGLVFNLQAHDEATWILDPATGIARRDRPRRSTAEVETCGRCHSRRSLLSEEYVYGRPLLDTHRIALLDAPLYEADGQIKDEVFEYGSFLQSKMYAAGVTCSDCHDPHGLARGADPDARCARCHDSARFSAPEHHFHTPGSAGARCVACHMPARTYMVVDPRHDHSFRVPRPDLSTATGSPDACTGCHAGRPPRWAAEVIEHKHPKPEGRPPHYGEALHAGRNRLPGAARLLATLAADSAQAAIVRATALSLLADDLGPGELPIVQEAISDSSPIVRLGATFLLPALDDATRAHLGAALLSDPVRAVRLAAAGDFMGLPDKALPAGAGEVRRAAQREYESAQQLLADRPESHLNLGAMRQAQGDLETARTEYETARRLWMDFAPAWMNLADVYRQRGDDAEGERVLREALKRFPDGADVRFALGLLLVRRHRLQDSLEQFEAAARLDSRETRYAIGLALALLEVGDGPRAVSVLEKAHRLRPGDREILRTLTPLLRDRGDRPKALVYARLLVAESPGDPAARQLLAELEAQP